MVLSAAVFSGQCSEIYGVTVSTRHIRKNPISCPISESLPYLLSSPISWGNIPWPFNSQCYHNITFNNTPRWYHKEKLINWFQGIEQIYNRRVWGEETSTKADNATSEECIHRNHVIHAKSTSVVVNFSHSMASLSNTECRTGSTLQRILIFPESAKSARCSGSDRSQSDQWNSKLVSLSFYRFHATVIGRWQVGLL